MPRFQLVMRGEGRLGVVYRTLHGLGFLAGAPGTGFTGASPFPQANAVPEAAGNMGPPVPAKLQLRFAPGNPTAVDPIPFVGFGGAWTAPFGRYVGKAVGIEVMPGLLPGRVVSRANCAAISWL